MSQRPEQTSVPDLPGRSLELGPFEHPRHALRDREHGNVDHFVPVGSVSFSNLPADIASERLGLHADIRRGVAIQRLKEEHSLIALRAELGLRVRPDLKAGALAVDEVLDERRVGEDKFVRRESVETLIVSL